MSAIQRNECLAVTTRELERHGITYMVEHGGKHLRLIWLANGRNHRTTVPCTSSDWRSAYNARSDLRRQMREAGVIVKDDAAPVVQDAATVTVVGGEVVCTSLDVARHFEKPHKDVLEAIDRIRSQTPSEFNERNFPLVGYVDAKGEARRSFELTRDGFSLLVMGFTGERAMKWKLAYIDAFNRMENELRRLQMPTEAKAEIDRLRADVEALTELVLEARPSQVTPAVPVVKARRPFVRPSVLRRMFAPH